MVIVLCYKSIVRANFPVLSVANIMSELLEGIWMLTGRRLVTLNEV